MKKHTLSPRQKSILEFIEKQMSDRGFPPSVREIGAEIGLSSPSTVHNHLERLQKFGYLKKDPSTPRGLRVSWDPMSGASSVERRPSRHVPLVGEVAAGTDVLAQENIEEMLPIPADFVGEGDLFMLKVRGESMIDLGILNGDFVIAKVQNTANNGDIIVAGIPGEEATVKTFKKVKKKIHLVPSNTEMSDLVFDSDEVEIYGKVVTVLRQL